MLLVNAARQPSDIHGLGLIAREFIPRGRRVWQFCPGFDLIIPSADFAQYPVPVREQIDYYGYLHEATQTYVLSSDDDRFCNHADDPNTRAAGNHTVAVRDIPAGGEITFNYGDPLLVPSDTDHRVYLANCDLGRGLFAAADVRAGETILTFRGPRISLAEALAKGDASGNPLQVADYEYIDLEPPGVFGNHSCDPNAGIVGDRVLIALRDIRFGEEVRFDYSACMWEEIWQLPCRCGSTNCRGIVDDFPRLPADVRDRYLGRGIVQSFIVERWRRNGVASPSMNGTAKTHEAMAESATTPGSDELGA